jgi:hypothetical protein
MSGASECCGVPGRSTEGASWVISFVILDRKRKGILYDWCLPGKLRCMGRRARRVVAWCSRSVSHSFGLDFPCEIVSSAEYPACFPRSAGMLVQVDLDEAVLCLPNEKSDISVLWVLRVDEVFVRL